MSNAQTEHENALPPEYPDLDPTWVEFELSHRVIGKTIVEYLAADNGDEFAGFRFQTRRENESYPLGTTVRWNKDKKSITHHRTGLDALEAANMYLPHSERKCMGSLLIMLGTMNADAALTIFNRLRKESK